MVEVEGLVLLLAVLLEACNHDDQGLSLLYTLDNEEAEQKEVRVCEAMCEDRAFLIICRHSCKYVHQCKSLSCQKIRRWAQLIIPLSTVFFEE